MPDEALFGIPHEAILMLIGGVLPAFAAAAVVMAAGERIGGAKQAPAVSSLALIVGTMLSLWLLNLAPLLDNDPIPWPATFVNAFNVTTYESPWNRLPWAVLAALCAERLARTLDTHTDDGWTLRAAAAFTVSWWLIPELAREESRWLIPALAATIFANWVVLERLTARPPDGGTPLCLALVSIAAGVVLVFAGIASFMQPAVMIGCALTGISAVAFWRRVDVSGAIPAVVVVTPTLLLAGQRESVVTEIPWYCYSLVAFAPLTLVFAWPLRDRPGVIRYLVRLGLVLIPLIAAVALTRYYAGPLDFGHPEDG